MKTPSIAFSSALLALLFAPSATAEIAVAYAGLDNTLIEDVGGALSNGQGASTYLGANNQGLVRRTVSHFDIASEMPPGSTINWVTFNYRAEQVSASMGGHNMAFHLMNQPWGEGQSQSTQGSGAPAEAGDATWIYSFYPTTTWPNSGGNFVATPSFTIPLSQTGTHTWTDPAMTAIVQDWLDFPATNYGWMIKELDEDPGVSIRLRSSEGGTGRPALIIDYTPPVLDEYFCTQANPNSTGVPTQLSGYFVFNPSIKVHLEATDGPPNQFGYFLIGDTVNPAGGVVGQGILCLDPNGIIGRYNYTNNERNSIGQFDANGVLQNLAGTSSKGSGFDVPWQMPFPGNPIIQSGQTWHYQVWHREAGMTSNMSNGLSVSF